MLEFENKDLCQPAELPTKKRGKQITRAEWFGHGIALLSAGIVAIGMISPMVTVMRRLQMGIFTDYALYAFAVVLGVFVTWVYVLSVCSLIPVLCGRFSKDQREQFKKDYKRLTPLEKLGFYLGFVLVGLSFVLSAAIALYTASIILGGTAAIVCSVFVGIVVSTSEIEAFLSYIDHTHRQTPQKTLAVNEAGRRCRGISRWLGRCLALLNAIGIALMSGAALFFVLSSAIFQVPVLLAFGLAMGLSFSFLVTRLFFYWERVGHSFGEWGAKFGNRFGNQWFRQAAVDNGALIEERYADLIHPDDLKTYRKLRVFTEVAVVFRAVAWGMANIYGMSVVASALLAIGIATPAGWMILTFAIGIISGLSALGLGLSFMKKGFPEAFNVYADIVHHHDKDERKSMIGTVVVYGSVERTSSSVGDFYPPVLATTDERFQPGNQCLSASLKV